MNEYSLAKVQPININLSVEQVHCWTDNALKPMEQRVSSSMLG